MKRDGGVIFQGFCPLKATILEPHQAFGKVENHTDLDNGQCFGMYYKKQP
jgi:hypothetical protein